MRLIETPHRPDLLLLLKVPTEGEVWISTSWDKYHPWEDGRGNYAWDLGALNSNMMSYSGYGTRQRYIRAVLSLVQLLHYCALIGRDNRFFLSFIKNKRKARNAPSRLWVTLN